jgi:hypothetical protein
MTAAGAERLVRPGWTAHRFRPAAVRLLGLELRHNAMIWLLPLAFALFAFMTYRKTVALPPLWNVRAASTQTYAVMDFVIPVVGAAAWMGSREARRRAVDLLETVSMPRLARLLAAWAATACWAVAGCLLCIGVVYWQTSQQASFGGPLWWPAAVAVATMPLLAALGFVAGVLVPSRFTAPAVAVATFFVTAISTELIDGGQSFWQVSPIVSGPWEIPSDPGVATFYPYLPDMSIVQLMFLIGLTVAVVAGGLGLRRGSAARRSRSVAAAAVVLGLLAAGTGVGLAGTARVDAHGMLAIPAIHNAADDRPLRYTPVCSHGAIPVCVNPAYASYLPTVASALKPVLEEIAGLPGAPVRVSQAPGAYRQQQGNAVAISRAGPAVSGSPPVYHVLLPYQVPGPPRSIAQMNSTVRYGIGTEIIDTFVGNGPGASAAQYAVTTALLKAARLPPQGPAGAAPGRPCRADRSRRCAAAVRGLRRGVPSQVQHGSGADSAAVAAARRFGNLPDLARRAWLTKHLAALRAGLVTVKELP